MLPFRLGPPLVSVRSLHLSQGASATPHAPAASAGDCPLHFINSQFTQVNAAPITVARPPPLTSPSPLGGQGGGVPFLST